MTPTIIIGLGSTGEDILLKIRKMIVEEYGGLDQMPIIAFLLIDIGTDTNNQKSQSVTVINKQNISLRNTSLRKEKIYIRVDQVDAMNALNDLFPNMNGVIEDFESNLAEVFEIPELNYQISGFEDTPYMTPVALKIMRSISGNNGDKIYL